MSTLRAAAIYFAFVFGAGFVLGPVRVLLLEPRIGQRAAELIEMPVMLMVIAYAARWVVRRRPERPLLAGLIALGILLSAEVGLGVALRGGSVAQILFDRDPVSGTAYFASMAVSALLPWWLSSR